MKFKRITSLTATILATILFITMVIAVNAKSTGYFNGYTTVKSLVTSNYTSYTSTQGMCINKNANIAFCVKTNSANTKAIILRTNMNTNEIKLMKDSSGNVPIAGLGHANDMEFVKVDGKKYIYVMTMSGGKSDFQIVKLEVDGGVYKKVASYYLVNSSGNTLAASGISYINTSGNNLNFMFKSGDTLYKAAIAKNLANKSTVKVTSSCKLDMTNSTINGKKISNIGSYLRQGFTYNSGKVFVPCTYENISVIFVFSIKGTANLSGTYVSLSNLSFRITSSKYSDKFEIESCSVNSDNKLYFNCNASDGSQADLLGCFKDYTF